MDYATERMILYHHRRVVVPGESYPEHHGVYDLQDHHHVVGTCWAREVTGAARRSLHGSKGPKLGRQPNHDRTHRRWTCSRVPFYLNDLIVADESSTRALHRGYRGTLHRAMKPSRLLAHPRKRRSRTLHSTRRRLAEPSAMLVEERVDFLDVRA